MTYDHWKTTNPDDEWLGPDPEDGCEEDESMDDHDPQPRAILDPAFNDRHLLDGVREATRVLYPEARIPETAMPTGDEKKREAATELYAALQFIFEHITDKERRPIDLYPAFGLDARRAIEMARAALAKARGEA